MLALADPIGYRTNQSKLTNTAVPKRKSPSTKTIKGSSTSKMSPLVMPGLLVCVDPKRPSTLRAQYRVLKKTRNIIHIQFICQDQSAAISDSEYIASTAHISDSPKSTIDMPMSHFEARPTANVPCLSVGKMSDENVPTNRIEPELRVVKCLSVS
jgi:hypothetical protein